MGVSGSLMEEYLVNLDSGPTLFSTRLLLRDVQERLPRLEVAGKYAEEAALARRVRGKASPGLGLAGHEASHAAEPVGCAAASFCRE